MTHFDAFLIIAASAAIIACVLLVREARRKQAAETIVPSLPVGKWPGEKIRPAIDSFNASMRLARTSVQNVIDADLAKRGINLPADGNTAFFDNLAKEPEPVKVLPPLSTTKRARPKRKPAPKKPVARTAAKPRAKAKKPVARKEVRK